MMKEFLCSIEIDRTEELANEEVSMHMTIKEYGGPWKGGWEWEAFSIEFADSVACPSFNREQAITPKSEPCRVGK